MTEHPAKNNAQREDSLLSAVVASSMDAMLSVDTNLMIRSWNAAAERLYGYAKEEAIGRPLGLLAPDKNFAPGPDFFRVLGGEQVYFEAQRRRKDGSLFEVGISSAPIRDKQGAVVGVSIVHRDITERKRAERALRQTQDWLELAQEAGNVSLWDYDPQSGEVHWPPQIYRQLGYDAAEIAPSLPSFRQRAHADDRTLLDETRRGEALAAAGTQFQIEIRLVQPGGRTIWIDRRSRVLEHDGRRRVIGVNIDITERKRQEEHLRFILRELTHRSKNLLAVVQGMASQSVRRATGFEDFEQRFLGRLRALAKSHDLLVDGNWSGAPLAELVASQLMPFLDDLGRVEIAGPAVFVNAEAAQALGIILHELAANAFRHGALSMPAGRISVHWARSGPAAAINLAWTESGGPQVVSPTTFGFGRTVIERLTTDLFGGHGQLVFLPGGVRWTAAIPATLLSTEHHDSAS